MRPIALASVLFLATLGAASGAAPAKPASATLAGGCFWCVESAYLDLPGVISVTSGYSGGHVKNPTYQQVSAGTTGHAEVVQVVYDPAQLSYEQILYVFWRNIDPLAKGEQFCDRGSQYRSAIFFHDDGQRVAAEASKKALAESGRFDGPIATEIAAFEAFYPAEAYHQGFCKTNPGRYESYRKGCGRDQRLKELWGNEAGGRHLPTKTPVPKTLETKDTGGSN